MKIKTHVSSIPQKSRVDSSKLSKNIPSSHARNYLIMKATKNDSIDVYYVQLVPMESVETKRGETLSNFNIKEGLFTLQTFLNII